MLQVFLTGIIIGLFISVPIGPLGILCIQRTLNRGRAYGIITGLGATTSDLIYAVLVGFGMNFIINFIQDHQALIQIVGSIIICGFGVHVFRSNPSKQLALSATNNSKDDYFSNYISAFLLCFSNPLIIFLLIGLFAQFQFFSPEQTIYEDIVGLGSILLGAFMWWLFITLIVSKFRTQFNVRGLWILNKITGSLLIALGIGGVVSTALGIVL